MSSFDLRQSDNGTYYVHWTEGRRSKRVSTRTRSLVEAKRFLAEWLTLESTSAKSTVLTCAEVWQAYLKGHGQEMQPTTLRSLEALWRNLEVAFGDLPVGAVTQAVVNDYETKRRTGKIGRASSGGTIRLELHSLKASWSWCAKRKIISKDDMQFFTVPPPAPARETWLRPEQVAALLAQAEADRMRATTAPRLSRVERFLWLAIETGARKTAIYELTWDRVDLGAGTIDYRIPGRRVTRKRRVVVPISSRLRPVLERAFAERINNFVLDSAIDLAGRLDVVGERAGVPVHPHMLRHTAATLMLRNGVSIWQVAGILGDTVATVEKHYGKHCQEHLREGVEMLGASWGAAPKMGVENDQQKPTAADRHGPKTLEFAANT